MKLSVIDWADAPPKGDAADVPGGAEEIRALVAAARPYTPPTTASVQEGRPATAPPHPYRSTPMGLVRVKPVGRAGEAAETHVSLTNFTAKIVAQVVEDDGSGDVRRAFEIEATLNGRNVRFPIRAERFESLAWASEHLGGQAIVWPGQREHAQVAIRVLSEEIVERRVYTHTGWREFPDGWAYLHAGGSIGSIGSIRGTEVRLPSTLERYTLPDPPDGENLVKAVRASLAFLDVAPTQMTVPLLAGVYRSVLGTADFGLHLVGPTGAGKSELAALSAQHFGAGLDARHLPGSWSSTGNALEALLFTAKDALVPIDDFAPTGAPADVQRLHRDADRVIRAQGNNSGRLRLQADTSLRAARPPRGTVVSTGEDVPRGQSLRARLLVLEVGPDDVDWRLLTSCQRDAADGQYALALAGFIHWLAPRYEAMQASLRTATAWLRRQAASSAAHRRTPEIVANLAFGFGLFIAFSLEIGASSVEEANTLWASAWDALGHAAAVQAEHQAASEPTQRFLELLASAISSGRAHVTNEYAAAPGSPEAWGWRHSLAGSGPDAVGAWAPQGRRVGWLTKEGLFLDPTAAHAAAHEIGLATGDPLAVGSKTLAKRLDEKGLLVSADRDRERLTTRRTFGKERPNVLHLAADVLVRQESTQPTQSARPGRDEQPPNLGQVLDAVHAGSIPWVDSSDGGSESTQQDRPTDAGDQEVQAADGSVGSIGSILRTPTVAEMSEVVDDPTATDRDPGRPTVSSQDRSANGLAVAGVGPIDIHGVDIVDEAVRRDTP